MTSLAEQLSTVRQTQWNAQLDLLNRLGSRTLDSTEQLIELNIKASRASMEQAASTVKQLFAVRDARDLFAIGAHAQGQWQQMFAYGRELMGIAAGARDGLAASATQLRLLPPPGANVPLTPSQLTEQAAIAMADVTTIASEIAGAAADIGGAMAEASLDASAHVVPDAAPVAKAVQDDVAAAGKAVSDAVDDAVSDTVSAAESVADRAVASVTDAVAQSASDAAAAPAVPVVAPDALIAPAPASPEHVVEAALDHAIAEGAMPAKAKPLVEALHEASQVPAGIAHPLASTVPLAADGPVELPIVTPAEHAPVVSSQGPAPAAPAGRERRSTKRK